MNNRKFKNHTFKSPRSCELWNVFPFKITHINSFAKLNWSRDQFGSMSLVSHLFDIYLIIEIEALPYMVVLIISLHNVVDLFIYFRDYVDPFVLTSTEIVQLYYMYVLYTFPNLFHYVILFLIFIISLYVIVFLVVLKWHV